MSEFTSRKANVWRHARKGTAIGLAALAGAVPVASARTTAQRPTGGVPVPAYSGGAGLPEAAVPNRHLSPVQREARELTKDIKFSRAVPIANAIFQPVEAGMPPLQYPLLAMAGQHAVLFALRLSREDVDRHSLKFGTKVVPVHEAYQNPDQMIAVEKRRLVYSDGYALAKLTLDDGTKTYEPVGVVGNALPVPPMPSTFPELPGPPVPPEYSQSQ